MRRFLSQGRGTATSMSSDTALVTKHVAYLRNSAERWRDKLRIAKHIEYLHNSERLAQDSERVAAHVAYLQRGPKRRESMLVAEHIAYLKRSAERSAATQQALGGFAVQSEYERQGLLLKQVASRIERLEMAFEAAAQAAPGAGCNVASDAARQQSWLLDQVASRIERLEMAIDVGDHVVARDDCPSQRRVHMNYAPASLLRAAERDLIGGCPTFSRKSRG